MSRRVVTLALCLCLLMGAAGCGPAAPAANPVAGLRPLELTYADQFTAALDDDGGALVTVGEDRFWIAPPDTDPPAGLGEDVTVLRRPLGPLYLASSSAADLFDRMGGLDAVRLTSTNAAGWRLPVMQQALAEGRILYAGKYSAPDFELLLEENCGLAIENTMIWHSPQIKEKLETLGVPVLVERSSYESHPLGRVEWIKLYGLLCGRLEEATRFFEEQTAVLNAAQAAQPTGRTVAFFHVSSAGAAVVRKPGDYVSKMIELAGGHTVFTDLGGEDNALSTVNMQMESFYAAARDADVLIYNSTIDGELTRLEDLLAKSPLLADFAAVKAGQVWCTAQSMFQQTSAAAGMIADLQAVLQDPARTADDLTYLHPLR